MKILSIEHNGYEQVGINTTRHNGGGCFSRYAKELLNNEDNQFFVCGYQKSFDNISDQDHQKNLLIFPDEIMEKLNNGEPVKNFIDNADSFDIVIHHRDSYAYNLTGMKAKQVYWSTFVNHTVHPNNHGALFYSYDQNPIVYNTTKCYKVKIGTFVPRKYTTIKKDNYIFICTRHDSVMDTNVILNLCIKNKIKCIVAGPILESYPLNIDNQYTFYLGEISNEQKNELSSKAFLYSCIQNWDTIFSLSAIESLAFGTPIIARNRGCFSYIIKDGVNGFFFDDEEKNFLSIIDKAKNINTEQVWRSAHEFSDVEMIKTFYAAFVDILKS
jgi:glycosyltransferase involved in cell wall biosynthesis